ncbi:DNA-binding protein [Mesorhizobium denitrificans]|uniref:DNA-binding protein n=1 Tax=Mesorhizobium denitrificans TaxID=2294114 RepID=A0A371XEQ0_9HYPH|nr:DNA-binding protein [Mesorhizobium denitrificans]RFC67705.1 DNA-binding protein [Mesorhizobium denitrificans]
MTDTNETSPLLWEVKEIAKAIGRTERATFHLLAKGRIPAKKIGSQWVCDREQLMNFFKETAA